MSAVRIDQSLLSYYIYRLAGTVAPLLPPRIGYALFGCLGDVAYMVSESSRENVCDNLYRVLGPQADHARIKHIARRVFRHQAYNYYDLFRLTSLSAKQIERLVTIYGLEHLNQALSAGKGVVLVSAHFGNLDVVSQALALRQYSVTAVAEHLRPEKLYQYVVSLRSSKGIKLVARDSFLRSLFQALRNNEIVGLAADRNLSGTGTLVEFFGAPALLPDGHVRLTLRTGAKLIPAFSVRRPGHTFEVFVEPFLELESTGNLQQDVQTGMRKLVAVLEKYIGQYPEQWVMFQSVW